MVAVEDFIDVGNILGKSWVSLYASHSVKQYKDGSWNWGVFAHRENWYHQSKFTIQVQPWDLSDRVIEIK